MPERHPHDPATPLAARFGWLTVSDTRTAATDSAGDLATTMIEAAGHTLVEREIVPDEPEIVRDRVQDWIAAGTVQAVVASGGTGISRRDRTYEALVGLLEQRLDGFGELFRMLSWEQVGSKALLSRATAGIVRGTPLFLLPGSRAAVELGLGRLILPEIGHLVTELTK
jgi:molybdenum cofactor biosynthesis protein B